MCRTIHALLSTAICGIQMLVRVFMTIILMLENLIRMILQTVYNFVSFMLQLLSLIPICVIFLVTTRLKCFMCGGGGPCPVNRGGACDCLMSAAAIVLLFFIFRAVGLLDKIFYKLGYVEATTPKVLRFVPTPGDVTECSRETTTMEGETGTGPLDSGDSGGGGSGDSGGGGSGDSGGGGSGDSGGGGSGDAGPMGPGDSEGEGGSPGGGYLRYDYSVTETEIIQYDSTTITSARKNALTPMGQPQSFTNTIEEVFARLDTHTVESTRGSNHKPNKAVTKSSNSKVTRTKRITSPSVLDVLSDHNLTTILYYLV